MFTVKVIDRRKVVTLHKSTRSKLMDVIDLLRLGGDTLHPDAAIAGAILAKILSAEDPEDRPLLKAAELAKQPAEAIA